LEFDQGKCTVQHIITGSQSPGVAMNMIDISLVLLVKVIATIKFCPLFSREVSLAILLEFFPHHLVIVKYYSV
jgi:hypothetical protein